MIYWEFDFGAFKEAYGRWYSLNVVRLVTCGSSNVTVQQWTVTRPQLIV